MHALGVTVVVNFKHGNLEDVLRPPLTLVYLTKGNVPTPRPPSPVNPAPSHPRTGADRPRLGQNIWSRM